VKQGESPLSLGGIGWTVGILESKGLAMSILKRGNSKFWYIQFQMNGKTYIRSSRTTDKRVAEQLERDWRRQLHAQQFLGSKEQVVIRDALEQFCESKKGTPNHVNLCIHARYLNRVFRTHRNLSEVTSEDLERLKQKRLEDGYCAATVKHTFNLFRGAWKHARRMGYQVSDIEFPSVRLPKQRLRYLSIDEEKALLNELDPRREASGLPPYDERPVELMRQLQDNLDLVILLLDTGARYAEIAGLEWSNINLDDRAISLWRPKVQNESVLYMTDRVHRVLNRRFKTKQGRYLFANNKGGKRGYSTVAIRKAFRRAALSDCKIHTLRHTHASRLIQNGINIYEVKAILGHADIKTTMRYAHLEQKNVSSRARDVINRLNVSALGRED
jgi:integrase